MRSWMTQWALASLLAVTVSAGGVSSASAQFLGGSGDREETRPSPSQQERPGVTERLRQWFEGEREARRQHSIDQQRMQAQRERRLALRFLYTAYMAGYMDGYQDAIDDHITLMLDKQDRQGSQFHMAPQQRGLSPREREQFRRSLRERLQRQMQQPRSEARRPTGAASQQQISGKILRTKRVELKNTRQEHLVALVESGQGQRRIVDLGPMKNLKDLDLSRGDRISIQGKTARAVGNVPVVLAQQLKAGDQQITIQRESPKQEQSQPKQDHEKKQQEEDK